MTVFKFFVFLSILSTAIGLSIVAKTEFEDADSESSGTENKAGDYLILEARNKTKNRIREYIPVVLKRSDRRIEARIPIIISKGKSTERPVPIIRGTSVSKRSDQLALENIEGLQPPSKSASDRWYQNQENYYPNVNGPYTTTPRPVYGVPSQTPNQPSWNNCPAWGSQNGGNYPPSNNYPNQGGSGYPPTQTYPNYPNNQYPMNNNYPSNQGGYPSNPSWGNGNNNPSWQNSNWGSQQPQSSWNSRQSGRWIPCGPIDLNRPNGQTRSGSGCSQISRASNPIRFEPPPSPASKIDDKTQFNQIPDDVEEIEP